MTGLGFLVAVPDDAVVALDAAFEFFVTVTAPDYANYTALSLRPQPIVDVTDPADTDVIHRYKANVPVLSNLTGASQGTGADKRLFLSQRLRQRRQRRRRRRGAGHLGHRPAPAHRRPARRPVPGARADVRPPGVRPPGRRRHRSPPRRARPARRAGGIELAIDTPRAVAAVIRLAPRRADDAAFSFANANGTPRTPTRVFEVHLRNRWTTWRYRKKGDGSVTATEADPLPLTHFGNAGTKQKPSTAAISVERDTSDPPKVTRLVSDIYV